MAQLKPELRDAIRFAEIDDPLERCLVLVSAQGGATGGNPAIHGDVGHFDHQQPCGAHRQASQMHQVPISRRSEEHTSELQSLMRISYAVFCLKKKKKNTTNLTTTNKFTH